jgi:signal transduction histidine kinase
MKEPLKKAKAREENGITALKHDIRNELSGIIMALDQLRYEMPATNADTAFYMDTIAQNCKNIDLLIKDKA